LVRSASRRMLAQSQGSMARLDRSAPLHWRLNAIAF
jgi:hypothetical protein